MATQNLEFKGKVRGCYPYTVNDWGKFSTRFYPVQEDLVRLKKLGIKNNFKMDDDGEYLYVSCPKEREMMGRKVIEKIDVRDKDNQLMDPTVIIGNGSDVVLGVSCYEHNISGSTKRGKAIRWRSLKVENHVPYTVDVPLDGTAVPYFN